MVNGIVRSPGSFFDVTPSGVLINKFSNDLGILDSSLVYVLIDTIEGPISIMVAMINICQIYPYFIPPVIVIFSLGIIFFLYARSAIIQCKQLDLKNKNPIFQTYSETITGLIQINIYNRRRSMIKKFANIIN
jgi:ATP-binding cassette, subfamily C (CFTR/MRP), member 4